MIKMSWNVLVGIILRSKYEVLEPSGKAGWIILCCLLNFSVNENLQKADVL